MPTLTPIPTRTPVVTPAPTSYFNDSTPSNWVEGITRSFAAAIQTAQTLKTAVGTSLIGKVNEYGNDFCVATGVVYGGDSIIGSYLTTILLSISGAMLIISLVRLGLWVVKFILDLIKIF
jgi:hypothetical protein